MNQSEFIFPSEGIEYASRLHKAGGGFVVLAHRTKDGGWIEKAVRAGEIDEYLKFYFPHTEDVYITQNRFIEKRRTIGLLEEINTLWADVDFYKNPELAGLHPQFIIEQAREILERERIPEPAIIISSGKGIYVLWLIEPISPYERPRWDRCQKRITEILKEIHADRKAIDAARVLRIPGSINTKNGARVETLHESDTVWNFEDLFREINPPEERPAIIQDINIQRAKRKASAHPNGWNGETLWNGRYFDLLTLKKHRWPNGIPEGHRDIFLFLSSVALSWIAEPRFIKKEIKALAEHCLGHWTDKHTLHTYKSSIERALKAAMGEEIEWQGNKFDPRFRFRTSTMVELLEIEPQEIRSLNLRYLITDSIRKERDSLRKRNQTGLIQAENCLTSQPPSIQAENCLTEYQYTPREKSLSQLKPWESEGMSRATWYRKQKEKQGRASEQDFPGIGSL